MFLLREMKRKQLEYCDAIGAIVSRELNFVENNVRRARD